MPPSVAPLGGRVASPAATTGSVHRHDLPRTAPPVAGRFPCPVAMTPVTVFSADDVRLDPFRNVKGQSVRDDGTFVAESELVLERLFASSIAVRSILITPARAERLSATLGVNIVKQGTPTVDVFVGAQSLIDEVVGYRLHRGVIAVADRPAALSAASLLSPARTVLVLENVMDPENVGSAFRHAAGFGVDAVILHGHTGDPLYRKTIRTSMGWTLGIPYARTPLDQPINELLSGAGFVTLALTPNRSAELLSDVLSTIQPSARVAFLLGAEGPGLRDTTLSTAGHQVRIPLSDGVDSLNIATAAAIALYALVHPQPSRLARPDVPLR